MEKVKRVVTEESINPNLKNVRFPWPNSILDRAAEIHEEMKKGIEYPFKEIHRLDAANPLAMGQKRLTYIQEVMAVVADERLLDSDIYPSDVKKRAKNIINNCDGNCSGAYSISTGIPGVRKQIAKYLEQRDGVPSHENDIILTAGVSEGVQVLLQLFSRTENGKPPGFLIPVPEYTLFKAVLAQYGLQEVKYFLSEEKNWSVDIEDLQRAIDESRSECDPKAIVIINPGNPGGYCMNREDIEDIIKFAFKENLIIMADEIYQHNTYDSDRPFLSFKKVMYEMGDPFMDMELASFMSASKGIMGECGSRSGFFEAFNIDDKVKETWYKILTIRVCPPILGQVTIYCTCNPPEPGESSFNQYQKEKKSILEDMKIKAEYGNKKFNSSKGMSCALVNSSMFFYPRIYLPNRALQEAKMRGLQPDELYCMELLEQTGICVLPGCHFGQKPGTYHFRYVFLHPSEQNKNFIDRIIEFHEYFMKKYAD